jgi:hypothetical protein
LYDWSKSIEDVIVVLCIQDRTFAFSRLRHCNLYVQMEKGYDNLHTEEFEHYQMQLPDYSHPSDIFGIHTAV